MGIYGQIDREWVGSSVEIGEKHCLN